MVFALAGDSTMTRFLAMRTGLGGQIKDKLRRHWFAQVAENHLLFRYP
jgi:hypothetical protein